MRINKLKTTYQRNMLLGQFVSLLIAAIFGLVIVLSEEPYVVIDTQKYKISNSFPLPQNDKKDRGDDSEKAILLPDFQYQIIGNIPANSGYDVNRLANRINGANGFTDFAIIQAPLNENLDDMPLLLCYGDDYDNWPIPARSSLTREVTFSCNMLGSEITPPKENRPMMISFVKPRHPSGVRSSQDATVKIGFQITKKGFVRNIDVITEKPEGFGFALAVKEALRESWIKPAVVDGNKTGGYYTLTYEFCRKCPDKQVVIDASANVIVTVK